MAEVQTATRVALVGNDASPTNLAIAAAWREADVDVSIVAASEVRTDDVVIGRLDILRSLTGVERGLLELLWLERRGVRVLNRARTLVTAHDKLLTARVLVRAGLPHPRTLHVRAVETLPELEPPVVVKPRVGSWGVDVFRCDTPEQLRRCLDEVATRPWFHRHGVLVQELVPPLGYDLRLIVSGGVVVGSVRRVAAPGEWRTNVSLGATRHPVVPPPAACELAVAAARAIGGDFVGVDLLPCDGGYTVIELNGAPDFNATYSLPGRDVFLDAAAALGLAAVATRRC
jgi:[lysine-biosynthesis-protein LysW]---L-2-aminoadipate ligase